MDTRKTNTEQATPPPEETLAPLKLRLFGDFAAWVCGRPLPKMRSRKETLLLALLALNGGKEINRVTLAQTLWPFPEHSTEQANQYLRRSLSELRHALGGEAGRLESPTPRTLRLDLSRCDCDVVRFDAALLASAGTADAARKTALRLYQGPLLHGFTEAWIVEERAQREADYRKTLRIISAEAIAAGEYDDAIAHLQRAIALDPFAEDARQQLMTALASARQYNAAFRAYQELADLLQRESNTRPDAATTALYLRLREAARSEAALAAASPPVERGRLYRLPHPLTPLIGREEALREIETRLSETRLVTLVGTGGVGKTRLSLQIAENAVERRAFTDGVCLAELAALTDATLLPQAVALALGVQESGENPLAALIAYLRSKSLLLILDNCEHLLIPCRELAAALLAACPRLRILATSRQPLGVLGENVWRPPALLCPPHDAFVERPDAPKTRVPLETIRRWPALQLFVERAAAVRGDFVLTFANAPAAARICQYLDGVPLCLELAAARINPLSVEEIAERLNESLPLLSRGNPTALPRHQTLSSLIGWSYDLLTEKERLLLTSLSLFRGGWTLAAAETICSSMSEKRRFSDILHSSEVLDLLTDLTDKCLVTRAEEAGGQTRFSMQESIRQFAEAVLNEPERAAEKMRLQARYAAYYLALAEEAEPRLRSGDQRQWLARLQAEQDNLRAALQWALRCDLEIHLRLTAALWRFWTLLSASAEGSRNLAEAVTTLPVSARLRALRARCQIVRGLLADIQGKSEAYQAIVEEGIREAREAGDAWTETYGNVILAWVYRQWDMPQAERILRSAVDRARELQDSWLIAEALSTLAFCCAYTNQKEALGDLLDDGLNHARATGDHSLVAELISHRGMYALHERRYRIAQACYDEARRINEALGNHLLVASALYYLGVTVFQQKEIELAGDFFRRTLAIGWEYDNARKIAAGLEGLAHIAHAKNDSRRAVCLLSAADVQRRRFSHPLLSLLDEQGAEPLRQRLQGVLDDEAFTLFWSRGALLPIEDAVRYAMAAKSESLEGFTQK